MPGGSTVGFGVPSWRRSIAFAVNPAPRHLWEPPGETKTNWFANNRVCCYVTSSVKRAPSSNQAQRGEARKKAERQRFFPTMAAGAVMMGGLDDDGLSFAFAPVPSGTIGSSSNPCNGNLAIKIISPGAHPTRGKAFRERFFASG